MATAVTMSLWPVSVSSALRVASSQMMTEPSLLPEANVFPSGVNARQVIVFLCPLRVPTIVSDALQHRQGASTQTIAMIPPNTRSIGSPAQERVAVHIDSMHGGRRVSKLKEQCE